MRKPPTVKSVPPVQKRRAGPPLIVSTLTVRSASAFRWSPCTKRMTSSWPETGRRAADTLPPTPCRRHLPRRPHHAPAVRSAPPPHRIVQPAENAPLIPAAQKAPARNGADAQPVAPPLGGTIGGRPQRFSQACSQSRHRDSRRPYAAQRQRAQQV